MFLGGESDTTYKIREDADAALQSYIANYKNDDEEIDPLALQGFTTSYAQMLNQNQIDDGIAPKELFYGRVYNKQSIGVVGGKSKVAAPPPATAPVVNAPPPATATVVTHTSKSMETDQAFLAEVDIIVKNNSLNAREKRKQISIEAQAPPYLLSKQEADILAETKIP